jgi:GrpB-like predicted nucleotidyltransferase (UPF0157 family)
MSEQTIYSRPNRPFRLEPYNPQWAKQFDSLAAELSKLLGDEVVHIEHMGSTAIPGMLGKPQIDVLVEVHDLSRIPAYYKTMEAAGYIPKGDYTLTGEEFFAKDLADGSRLASVHIWPTGNLSIQRQLDFREYLKSHQDEIDGYNRAKQAAFDNAMGDYNAYYKAKSPYILALIKRVESWRSTQAKPQ